MGKMKKSQIVENYLEELLQQDDFGSTELEGLKYRDIIDAKELNGIGDRTISNVLNSFKEKKGIKSDKRKMTKKKVVEEYLTNMWETGSIKPNTLQQLRYDDLKDEKELSDIGKTTLTCALAEFKKKHNRKTFETGILEFLTQEKDIPDDGSVSVSFSADILENQDFLLSFENIKWIRKMIHEFEKRQSVDEEKKLFELRELKHALHFVGINPQTIVHKYWEVVSKDFMNQKILSNKSVNNADFKVSGYV